MGKFLLLLSTLFLLVMPTNVKANYILFGAPVSVNVTSVSAQVIAANTLRSYLIFINTGSNTVYVKANTAQSATEGIPIPAGGNYEPYKSPANAFYADTAADTSTLTIVQGQ